MQVVTYIENVFCTKWGFLTNRNFTVCVVISHLLLFNNLVIYLIVQDTHSCVNVQLLSFLWFMPPSIFCTDEESRCYKWRTEWVSFTQTLFSLMCVDCNHLLVIFHCFFTYAYVLSVTVFSLSSKNYFMIHCASIKL